MSKLPSKERVVRASAAQEEQAALLAKIDRLLKRPNELVNEVTLPPDLAMALASNRPEMLMLLQPRAMDATEVGHLYKFIVTLMATNQALQEHAQHAGEMAKNLRTLMLGTLRSLDRLDDFANFRPVVTDEDTLAA